MNKKIATAWTAMSLAATRLPAEPPPQYLEREDADDWKVEAFCGTPPAQGQPAGGYAGHYEERGFAQGPRSEVGAVGAMAFDSRGNAYVACESFIEVITAQGQARVLTGNAGISGNTDGLPGQATFGHAIDIALDTDDRLYVADAANLTIRKIERRDGLWHTETVAGVPGVAGRRDGAGRQALFTSPLDSVAIDEHGTVYVMDGDWLRKIEDGAVTTLNAGPGYRNGPLSEARFCRSQGLMHGLAYDGRGNLYVADKVNHAIRKVALKEKEVTTFAGRLPGEAESLNRDGRLLEARFHSGGGPIAIFMDPAADRLIVFSDDEGIVRAIEGGWVRTFGSIPGPDKPLFGPWRKAASGLPCGIDRQGNVYVLGQELIRVVRKEKGGRP
jgi:hypothetical protein